MEIGYLYFLNDVTGLKSRKRIPQPQNHIFKKLFFLQQYQLYVKSLRCHFNSINEKLKTFSSCQYLLETQAFCSPCLHIQLSVKKCTERLQYFLIT